MNKNKTNRLSAFLSLALAFILVLNAGASTPGKKDKQKDQEEKKSEAVDSKVSKGLTWRSIGPAFTSGRIADFAVNPENKYEWYVAVAAGHVWKTVNNGTTFSPVFDNNGVYSIGVVTIDPSNSNVVWVGTGENNHQRALGYGNGVYKSEDGGASWKNMGLKDSRQIGGIVISPCNSDIVFVAAEGSAWGPGGDRGLYKSTDGGASWKKVLEISENTGVNNVVIDPVDPKLMYATSEQRRRHVFTKIGGGPESAVYRSKDGGDTWEKAMSGLPSVDIGGMGIAVSPVDHEVVYLIVEAAEGKGGFFRSTNRGASWSKMSDYSSSGQYYNEIYCDPVDVDKVYSMETYSKFTLDGGKTWSNIGNSNRHVDDHALWVDPDAPQHMFIGGDGGIYETFDGGKTYLFKSNLPVTQFYRVFADNALPFYNVYGGTQDNNTLAGPSRNFSSDGVTNEEWRSVNGGDGFWAAVDPEDPNIAYVEAQYGNMYRYDRRSNESQDIKPQPREGELTYKWNWNAPLVISKHKHTRIYTMANKVFKSDDRGNTWEVISDDLTSGTDRNTWPVMGQFWSRDAVAKDVSTSLWGTGVSFAESPLNENILFAGTDDGVLSITSNGGKSWTKVSSFPGVPDYSYVSDILPDRFDPNTVYVSLDNLKRDDFKPYLLVSHDLGKTWTSIANGLPDATVHSIEQDPEVPGLLFIGTEFAIHYSIDGGASWMELGSGLPSIAVRDITIQERENDLVIATFGRGFYILDDYTPIREVARAKSILDNKAVIFPVKDALMYIQDGGKYGQGASLYKSDNPEFGATVSYFVKEVPETLKQQRKKAEKELIEAKKPVPQPSTDQLRKEEEEIDPYLVFTISDMNGSEIRKLTKKASEGLSRISWDLRYSSPRPLNTRDKNFNPLASSPAGLPVMPGTYKVSMDLVSGGEVQHLAGPVEFVTVPVNNTTLPASDRAAMVAFQNKASVLAGRYMAMERRLEEQLEKVTYMEQAILQAPGVGMDMMKEARAAEMEIKDLLFALNGPEAPASYEELPPMDMPLKERLMAMIYAHWSSTADITSTEKTQYNILEKNISGLEARTATVSASIQALGEKLNKAGAPWTPGR